MSVMVAKAKCSACGAMRTIIHTDWQGYGGKLETPKCWTCGRSWSGYDLAVPTNLEPCLVVWDEAKIWPTT